MTLTHLGELFALGTAVCWTFTALSFESAGKRVGSRAVNLIRLCLGLLVMVLFNWARRGQPLPLDATAHQWFWLSLSGLVGFSFGDLMLFEAFVRLGARTSMLIMAGVPLLTVLFGWFLLGETLTAMSFIGMVVTLLGIALVVLERPTGGNLFSTSRPLAGLLFASGGALGQAAGLVLSKYGMGSYDAFAATQIRLISGLAGFSILFFFLRTWPQVFRALRNGKAMAGISTGAFFGPFLGVSFSLLAIQHTVTGVASTIMAITPVLIIAPAVVLFKEKVTAREIIGAFVAVAGVAILFLRE
jgi:drug/metabolite transporter (DMT)-like permease